MEVRFPSYSYSAPLDLWKKVPYFDDLVNGMSMCEYVCNLDMPMSYLDQMFRFLTKQEFNPTEHEFSVYDFYNFLNFVFNKKIDMLELYDFLIKNQKVIENALIKAIRDNNFLVYIFTYTFNTTDSVYQYIEKGGEATRNFYMMYENYLHNERMLIAEGTYVQDGVMTIRDVTKPTTPNTFYDDILTINTSQQIKSIRVYRASKLVSEYVYNEISTPIKIHCPKASTYEYIVVVRFK